MYESKKLANALMAAEDRCRTIVKTMWLTVHNLSEWTCGNCGHGGLGDEVEADADGVPMCPWCGSDLVKPRERVLEQDVADADDR